MHNRLHRDGGAKAAELQHEDQIRSPEFKELGEREGKTIMALRKLRMICAGGDKTLAEWETDSVTAQRLSEIEKEFNEKMAQGWFAADISEKRDVLIRQFDPNAEILLIPRVQGGL